MLAEFLTSKSRSTLLGIFFDGRDSEYYLRQLEGMAKLSVRSIQKEVAHMYSLDLILLRKDGNRTYYKANIFHPIYSDLVSIVEKTVGVIGQLRDRLSDKRVECAFLFGSFAKGKEKAESDIDLVVIGDLGMRVLTKLLSGLQEKIGREINPHIFTKEEFKHRVKNEDHFVTSILKIEIKPIIGSLDEYRELS